MDVLVGLDIQNFVNSFKIIISMIWQNSLPSMTFCNYMLTRHNYKMLSLQFTHEAVQLANPTDTI